MCGHEVPANESTSESIKELRHGCREGSSCLGISGLQWWHWGGYWWCKTRSPAKISPLHKLSANCLISSLVKPIISRCLCMLCWQRLHRSALTEGQLVTITVASGRSIPWANPCKPSTLVAAYEEAITHDKHALELLRVCGITTWQQVPKAVCPLSFLLLEQTSTTNSCCFTPSSSSHLWHLPHQCALADTWCTLHQDTPWYSIILSRL